MIEQNSTFLHIYPVGFYRDIHEYLINNFRPKWFLYWFSQSWKRKSYWNGFLTKSYQMPEGVRNCGIGKLPILSLWNFYKNVTTSNNTNLQEELK